MAIPPNIKARLDQLKMEAAVRAEADRRRALAQQNAQDMAVKQQPVQKAEGGFVNDNHREWFGDSKVTDKDGNPLTVYHGTSKDTDFGKFKIPKNGAWFTDDKYTASAYADENDSRGLKTDDGRNYREVNTASRVMPVHLRIEKPYTPTHDEMTALIRASNYKREQGKLFEKARAMGHDGIDMGNGVWVAIGQPTQVKSALGNRGTFDPKNPDITKAKGGEVKTPSLDAMKLALNNQRMYSPLEKAAMAVPRTKGTPAEFMAEVSKQPGFRKDEVEDRKISLPEQKMTKEEFLGHIKQHPAPLLEEKVLGGNEYRDELDNVAKEMIGDDYATYDDLYGRDQDRAEATVRQRMGYNPETKHEQWQLPGGDNYREVLLKLPQRGLSDRQRDLLMMYEADERRGKVLGRDHQRMYDELKARQQAGNQDFYAHNHWDDPNVVAHVRLSDRNGPNGEKILHVEEVQSDWHQQGRRFGYQGQHTGKMAEYQGLLKQFEAGTLPSNQYDHFYQLQDDLGGGMEAERNSVVPDGPFKKNWHELALKHVLGEAARGGYHGIAITPGDVQADRYDLTKHIQQVMAAKEDDGFRIFARDHQGKNHDMGVHAPEQLGNVVGKDLAEKIATQTRPTDTYEGVDLKVGGEGMKGFYDKIVPTFLNKLGKPHGAQVGTIDAVTKPEKRIRQIAAPGLGHFPPDVIEPAQTQTLHYFPITDSLRQQITQEGLPQYDKGGKVDPIEEMRRQLGQSEPFDPVGNLKRNVTGAWQVLKNVPGNLQRLATDPVAYIRSLPAPTGEQIMNMAGPGNIGFAGMMIGPKARTFHTGRAEMAKAMEEAGRTPQEIWTATGTVKGPDGIWRQEISDKGSTFNMLDDLSAKVQQYKAMIEAKKAVLRPDKSGQKDFWPKALTEAKKPVREEIAGLKQDLSEISKSPRTQGVAAQWTLEHPELYAAYPELGALPVVQNYKSGPEKGSLTSSGGRLYQMDVHDPIDPRSIALHEMQHAIQGIEGMAPGANPSMAFRAPEYAPLLERIRSNPEEFTHLKVLPRDTDKAAFEWYRRQHGEAEARATQARRDMDAAQRAAKFPYESFDVPQQQLLMRQPESNPGKVMEARGGRVHPLLPDFED